MIRMGSYSSKESESQEPIGSSLKVNSTLHMECEDIGKKRRKRRKKKKKTKTKYSGRGPCWKGYHQTGPAYTDNSCAKN